MQRLTQLTDSPPPPAADLFLLFFTSVLRQRSSDNAAQHQRVKEKRAEYNQSPRVERVAATEFQKADC